MVETGLQLACYLADFVHERLARLPADSRAKSWKQRQIAAELLAKERAKVEQEVSRGGRRVVVVWIGAGYC